MTLEQIDNFKGLYTAADSYSTPGSPNMNNWDVNINSDIEKTKGYTDTTASSVDVTNVIASTDAVLLCMNTIPENGTVVVHDIPRASIATELEGYAWNVKSRTNSEIELDGADISGYVTMEGDLKEAILFNDVLNVASITNNGGISRTISAEVNSRNISMYDFEGAAIDSSGLTMDLSSLDYNRKMLSVWTKPNFDTNASGGGVRLLYAFGTDEDNKSGRMQQLSSQLAFWGLAGDGDMEYKAGWASGDIVHFAFIVASNTVLDGGNSVALYQDGTLKKSSSTPNAVASAMSSNSKIGGYGGVVDNRWYGGAIDFTIYDYDLLAANHTDASIIDQVYDNTFDGAFKFAHEFIGNTATIDLSMQNLKGFAASGGLTLE